MIEERLKNKPLPPPPIDGSAKSTCEVGSKSRDGDSDIDVVRSGKFSLMCSFAGIIGEFPVTCYPCWYSFSNK